MNRSGCLLENICVFWYVYINVNRYTCSRFYSQHSLVTLLLTNFSGDSSISMSITFHHYSQPFNCHVLSGTEQLIHAFINDRIWGTRKISCSRMISSKFHKLFEFRFWMVFLVYLCIDWNFVWKNWFILHFFINNYTVQRFWPPLIGALL